MQSLTIDRLSREDGFSLMSDLAAKNSVPYAISAVNPGKPMKFDLAHQFVGGLSVSRVTAGNYSARRGDSLVRQQSEPRVIVQIPEQPVVTEHGGHQIVGTTGSVVAMWSLSAIHTEMTQPASVNAVTVPLDDLALPHRMLRELMGRDLGGSPFAPIITAYLTELVRSDLDEADAHALERPTTDLIRVLLTSAAGDEFTARRPLGDTIGARIMLHLRAHLDDPDLTADAVAARFSISRRYLYIILNRMGVSLGEWVRTERLTLAAATLQDPAQAEATVAQIARRVGFADHSSFSRAFRAAYGVSPTSWRDHPNSG